MEKPRELDVVKIVRGGTARERPQEFDVKKYVRLLYKKRYAFVAVMMVVTGIIVAVAFLLPDKYEATSIVLVEGSYANDAMKSVSVPASIDDRVTAVATIMQSRSQVLKVLKELGYDLGQYTEGEVEQLVGSFQRATKITVDSSMSRRDVDMFTVSLRHGNPAIARDYVNALVRLYIADSLSTRRDETVGTKKFLTEQVDIFKQRISAIEAEMKRVREASSQERLAALQERLHELLSQYAPQHPEVEKVREEMADLERQPVKRKPMRGMSRDSDQDLLASGTDPAAKTARTGGAASPAMAGTKQKLKELERDRDTYQKMYEEMLTTLGKSEVSTRLEVQDKGVIFNVLEPAALPLGPISPNRVLIIVLGFFAGMGVAMAFVILMDSMDKSIKSVDAVRSFGLPVLAVFPHTRLPREIDRTEVMNLLLFAVTLMYCAGIAVLLMVESSG